MLTHDRQRAALKALLAEMTAAGDITEAMTAEAVLGVLTAASEPTGRTHFPKAEVRRALDPGEFLALTERETALIKMYLEGEGEIDLADARVSEVLGLLAAGAPKTAAALQALRAETQTPLAARGLPVPTPHQLAVALGKT